MNYPSLAKALVASALLAIFTSVPSAYGDRSLGDSARVVPDDVGPLLGANMDRLVRHPVGPNAAPLPPSDPSPSPQRIDETVRWVESILESLPDQTDEWAAIDTCVEEEMNRLGTPGASIAIAVDGELAYAKGYGLKHATDGGEVGTETMFRIGSTTKQMTSAAVMQLVDQGRVSAHEALTTYLPALRFQDPWRASDVTVHNLLAQDSGIPDTYLLTSMRDYQSTSLSEWAERLAGMPMFAPPGEYWNYANPNFSLAGLIVEEVADQPFPEYVEEHVWEPAGMPLTTFDPQSVREHGDFAWGHYQNQVLPPEFYSWPAVAPAGAAVSTPTEMVTWALTLMDGGGEVLSPESAAAMQSRQVYRDYRPWQHYGYGIFVTDYADVEDPEQFVTVFDHGGNVQGFSSQLYWIPERSFAVSVLANTMTSLAGSAHCALEVVAGVEPRSDTGLTTDPAQWDLYEGTYAMMNTAFWGWTAQIERQGNWLMLEYLDMPTRVPLVQRLPDTFLPDQDADGEPDSNVDFTFIRDQAAESEINWVRNRSMVGQRVGRFPSEVKLWGAGCSELALTSDLDIENLDVRAAGLVPPQGVLLRDVPIVAGDPSDPTTAGYKHAITVDGEALLFFAALIPSSGDNLELYLLQDGDGNGEFTFPEEVLSAGLQGAQNSRLLHLGGRQPGGDYQLWVHATSVQGDEPTFDLDLFVIDGLNLAVHDAPSRASKGAAYTLKVCAHDVDDLHSVHSGIVDFSYGYPPRRVRIPVTWHTGRIYLPQLSNRE